MKLIRYDDEGVSRYIALYTWARNRLYLYNYRVTDYRTLIIPGSRLYENIILQDFTYYNSSQP